MDINKIANMLKINIPKEDIYINEPMSKHTTFKIGGNADVFVKARKIDDIAYIIKVAQKEKVDFMIIGNGSNLLVRDKGIRGIVIKNCIEGFEMTKGKDHAIVNVTSGMLNSKFAQILLKEELKGFEFAAGIPGTIGGAIKMNAGAYGSEIKDIIEDITYIDLEDNTIKTINKDDAELSYRHSIFSEKKCIIISAKFKFEYGNKEEIANKIQENFLLRKSKQPIEKPCAGSTFKRGKDFITAQIIDEVGLKGKKIGGAEISEKHAGFIVNNGNATAQDVIELVDYTKKTVKEKTGKNIELEVEIVGE